MQGVRQIQEYDTSFGQKKKAVNTWYDDVVAIAIILVIRPAELNQETQNTNVPQSKHFM